jgi:hypothetical protein
MLQFHRRGHQALSRETWFVVIDTLLEVFASKEIPDVTGPDFRVVCTAFSWTHRPGRLGKSPDQNANSDTDHHG